MSSGYDRRQSGQLCPHLVDDEGFTTIAMAIAMLITLALLFSAAQIYRLQTESAAIQEVADTAALAAENVVAEYMIAVRICDAVVLSMSLLTLTVFGVSVVLLCIPFTQGIAGDLISLATKIMNARNSFADKASEGLNKLARALPYLAAASAAAIGAANSKSEAHAYIGCAVLVPASIDEVDFGDDEQSDAIEDEIKAHEDELATSAQKAEEAAKSAEALKQKGYQADCGRDPGRCMKERAEQLAGMVGAENPAYRSVDAWSFSVALRRAQAYFRHRAADERPASDSVEEQSNSHLRSFYYAYCNELLADGYVHEGIMGAAFEANFPLPPRNTDEMRQTRLYTDAAFPLTMEGDSCVLHAWPGCPRAAGATAYGSLLQMETGGFIECPVCHFKASDLGKIGSASSSIDTGFEYHYREVAEAASAYEDARASLEAESAETRELSQSLFDRLKEAMTTIGGRRISIAPPGYQGAVALVADLGVHRVDSGLASSLVTSAGTLGPRAAVSAATLIEEPDEDVGNVITSFLDGFGRDGGAVVGAARIVLSAWSSLLGVYTNGVEGLQDALTHALDGVPLLSASGLGSWCADTLGDTLSDVGLEPANLSALKPVLVNTGRVTATDGGAFSVRYRSIKTVALESTAHEGGVFGFLIDEIQTEASDWIGDATTIEIACIELPIGDLSFPITISLPPAVADAGQNLLTDAAESLKSLIGSVMGGSRWR